MNIQERIFYGAIEEFKESGTRFTMDSLARRLGISKRTLYETVPSKEAVVELVIDRSFQDVKEQQKEILNNEALSTREKVIRMLTIIPAYADRIDYRRSNEIKKSYPELYKKVEHNIENDWDATLQLLAKAMDEGILVRRPLIILKEILCAIFEKLLDSNFLIQNNITYETAMKEIITTLFQGMEVR